MPFLALWVWNSFLELQDKLWYILLVSLYQKKMFQILKRSTKEVIVFGSDHLVKPSNTKA